MTDDRIPFVAVDADEELTMTFPAKIWIVLGTLVTQRAERALIECNEHVNHGCMTGLLAAVAANELADVAIAITEKVHAAGIELPDGWVFQ